MLMHRDGRRWREIRDEAGRIYPDRDLLMLGLADM
jgi:hypothetical protein